MIIDPVIDQTPKRNAFVDIVVLSLLVVTSPVALYIMSKRISRVDYSLVAKPLDGEIRFSPVAIILSIPVILLGFIGFIGSIVPDDLDFGFTLFWMMCGLCELVVGIMLLVYGISYSSDTVRNSDALISYAKKTGLIDTKHAFSDGKVKLNTTAVKKYLDAFKRYGVIEFKDEQNGIYTVKKFHPLIEKYFSGGELTEPPELPVEALKWTCRGCGAVNTSGVCEYCGRVRC